MTRVMCSAPKVDRIAGVVKSTTVEGFFLLKEGPAKDVSAGNITLLARLFPIGKRSKEGSGETL